VGGEFGEISIGMDSLANATFALPIRLEFVRRASHLGLEQPTGSG
jgi:hypothetical protein